MLACEGNELIPNFLESLGVFSEVQEQGLGGELSGDCSCREKIEDLVDDQVFGEHIWIGLE